MRIGSGITEYQRALLVGSAGARARAADAGPVSPTEPISKGRSERPPVAQVVEGEVLGRRARAQYQQAEDGGSGGVGDPFGSWRADPRAGGASSEHQQRLAAAIYQAHSSLVWGEGTSAGERAGVDLYA